MNAKTQALRDVEDNSERIERKKAEAEKKETELVAEEKVLERIRDSLKGRLILPAGRNFLQHEPDFLE